MGPHFGIGQKRQSWGREGRSMATLQEIAVRIITDDTFAQALLANPEKILLSEGIEPTQEILDVITQIDIEELRSLTVAFTDESKAM